MKKKFVGFLIMAALLFVATFAAAEVITGTCGWDHGYWGGNPEVTWTLDTSTGTFTVSGNDTWYDFTYAQMGGPYNPFQDYKGQIKHVIIEGGVTRVSRYAFLDCKNLVDVTFGEGVSDIGEYAFANCTQLTTINLPSTLRTIGEDAFFTCTVLQSVTFPEGLLSIGEGAFCDCKALRTVETYGNIGPNAFGGTGLVKVTVHNADTVDVNAFRYCDSLTTVSLCEGITAIKASAFEECKSLSVINIPESVTSIEKKAFYKTYKLASIKLPEGLTYIGKQAFYASGLTSVEIPDSVMLMEPEVFWKCENLLKAELSAGTNTIPEYTFCECSSLQNIVFPEGLTLIGDNAFTQCSSLLKMQIPEGVLSIGSDAFSSCTSLTEVTFPSSLTSIGSYCFIGCSSLPAVIIPEGLLSIPKGCFNECSSLASVSIPKSVISIGLSAFDACPLKKVIYSGTAEEWNLIGIDSYNTSLTEAYANSKDSPEEPENPAKPEEEETTVTVKNGKYELNAKKNGAIFTGPAKMTLKSLVIQDKVKIGGKTYKVTEVAASACEGMKKLETLVIGKNVTRIGAKAFYNCGKLKDVTIKTENLKAKYVGSDAFGKNAKKITVKCPKSKVKTYKKWLVKKGVTKNAIV